MRRAFVISLFFHLFVASLFMEWLDFPAGRPTAGDLRLSAALRPALPEALIGRQVVAETSRPVAEPVVNRLASQALVSPAVRAKSARIDARRPESMATLVEVRSVDSVGEADRALSPEVESEYRLRLGRALRQEQISRATAHAHRGVGSVGMYVVQRNGLAVPEVVLASSSGHVELDRLALSDVQAVLDKVALPAGASGQAFRMSFVLDYRPAE